MILQKLDAISKREGQGKLAPTWEGPFRIIKVVRSGIFHLEDLSRKRESHAWNIQHFKGYYV